MNNPVVLYQLSIRVSRYVLEVLSKISGVRELLLKELGNQHVWYLRVLELNTRKQDGEPASLPEWAQWEGNEQENWRQVYYILARTETNSNPFLYREKRNWKRSRDVLTLNKYNFLAVRVLLEWGYVNSSLIQSNLEYVVEHGDLPVIRFLLDVPRDTKGRRSTWFDYAIRHAARRVRMDIFQLLLAYGDEMTKKDEQQYDWVGYALEEAVVGVLDAPESDDSLVMLRYVHEEWLARNEEPFSEKTVLRSALRRRGNIRMLELLISLQMIDPKNAENRDAAVEENREDVLKLFLGGEAPNQRDWLMHSIRNGFDKIVKFILSDPRVTTENIQAAIAILHKYYIKSERSRRIVVYLISDPRAGTVKKMGELLLERVDSCRLGKREYGTSEFLRAISESSLELSSLPSILRITLQGYGLDRLDHYIEGTGSSQSHSEEFVLITRELDICFITSFKEHHYQMFLFEVLVRPFSPEKYLQWLLGRIRATRSRLESLFGSVAQSILQPERPVKHTSPEFTAYSGFFLYLLSDRSEGTQERIVTALRDEGASEEGLDKLRALMISAYVAEKELLEENKPKEESDSYSGSSDSDGEESNSTSNSEETSYSNEGSSDYSE